MDVSFASCAGPHAWRSFVVSGVKHRDCANCGRVEHLIPGRHNPASPHIGRVRSTWAPGLKEFDMHVRTYEGAL